MDVKIIKCSCKHEYQDQKYGENLRVHIVLDKSGKISYRCTVCGNTKSLVK